MNASSSEDNSATPKDANDDQHEGDTGAENCQLLDASSFPRFAPLLVASQHYAELSGCRFRAGSFSGLQLPLESCGAELSTAKSGCRFSGKRLQVKIEAAPAVQEFSRRLLAGEPALLEELERASRIVMAETVRNAVVATCRKFDLWPPSPPTPGVSETDCSYEDTSAKLDVIAQRAYHDEIRRESTEEWGASKSGLARRALTASYLVDFASENGAPLPPLPETFRAMLAELEQRAAEWEAEVCCSYATDAGETMSPKAALKRLSNFSLSAAADNLRTLRGVRAGTTHTDTDDRQPSGSSVSADASQVSNMATDSASSAGGSSFAVAEEYDLVIDTMSAYDLQGNPGLPASKITSAYVEMELGDHGYKTAAQANFKFEGEVAKCEYKDQPQLTVRVRVPGGLQSFLLGDPLVGKIVLPLGPDLYDCIPRKMELPLSHGTDHAGVVSLRLFLRLKPKGQLLDDLSERPPERPARSARFMSAADVRQVGAVVGAVASAVDAARDGLTARASLRTREGFGTCARHEASVIIVTEEGTRFCYYYPYSTQDEASSYFNSRRWWLTSRIMFRCENGIIGDELCQGGPFMAHRTIRKASRLLSTPEGIEADQTFSVVLDESEMMPE